MHMVRVPGIEPGLQRSKHRGLPLHYTLTMCTTKINDNKECDYQGYFSEITDRRTVVKLEELLG